MLLTQATFPKTKDLSPPIEAEAEATLKS